MHPENYARYGELRVVLDVLKKEIPDFPKSGDCRPATRVLHDTLGLEMVGGLYMFDEGGENERKPEDHWLAYDRRNDVYIDLTQGQFSSRLRRTPPAIVVKQPNELIEFAEANDMSTLIPPKPEPTLVEKVREALNRSSQK